MALQMIPKDEHLPLIVPAETDFDGKEFLDAPHIRTVANELIRNKECFAHLEHSSIVYLWKKAGGKSQGKPILGKVQATSPLTRFFSETQFIMMLSADHLFLYGEGQGKIPHKFAEALVFHELCHLGWDAEKGQVEIQGHQYEGFFAEIEQYGIWRTELAELHQTMKQMDLL